MKGVKFGLCNHQRAKINPSVPARRTVKNDWEQENQVDRTLDRQQQRKNKREAEAAQAGGNKDRLMQVVDNKEGCPDHKGEKN